MTKTSAEVSDTLLRVAEQYYDGQASALYSILSMGRCVTRDIADRAHTEVSCILSHARKRGWQPSIHLTDALAELDAILADWPE